MSRVKISEFKAKSIVLPQLGLEYNGVQVVTTSPDWKTQLSELSSKSTNVVKVDQGVKKRAKTGLLLLNVSSNKVEAAVKELEVKGYNSFLIEPFLKHDQSEEQYLALQRGRDGIKLWHHTQGGIDIEEAATKNEVKEYVIKSADDVKAIADAIKMPFDMLKGLIDIFEKEYFAFLEINPLLIKDGSIVLLDLAIEVDSAGDYFVTSWSKKDFVQKNITISEEINVVKLSEKSPSSFKLEVLNGDGAIWMLLSGGGASLVIADEYNNLGKGKLIGNYGEYSGAPNADETYEYAKQILSLLLKSAAKKKVLLIAGGVANFTDVSVTFKGIVRAMEEEMQAMKSQNVSIYVRRGGPQQEKGLKIMRDTIEKHKLNGFIAGPELSLNEIVKKSLESL